MYCLQILITELAEIGPTYRTLDQISVVHFSEMNT